MKLGFGLSLVGQRAAGGAAAFTPASLFASGEEGGWWDIHPDYLFQNDDGTTAAGVGDPVGYVTDRSGNGHHLTQATTASKPTLRQTAGGLYYLEFDGGDILETASIDFSASDEISVFAGATRKTSGSTQVLVELSASYTTNDDTFYVLSPASGGTRHVTTSARGDAAEATDQIALGPLISATPETKVITGLHDISEDTSVLRLDGVDTATGTGDKGAGNFGNYPLYVGGRGSGGLNFEGDIYSIIVRGKYSTAQEVSDAESYVAEKTGVTL